MRREWIEIKHWVLNVISSMESPSMRREWIEIWIAHWGKKAGTSPSMRREWIEI